MPLLTKRSTRKQIKLKKSNSQSGDIEYSHEDLPSLRRKRTIAYKRLAKALVVGTSAHTDFSQRDLFLSYHQEIKQIAASFEDAHLTILEILNDPESDDNEMQETFDDMYYRVLSIHRNLTKSEPAQSQSGGLSSNIRLPKIILPSFAGNIKQWPEYFDTFNALIHNSTSLTDTEKFHYLISSLSGDALSIVKTFPLSHEHYRDAYEALTARYKSKRDLAFTCWHEILNIELKHNNALEFRKSLDLLEENLCILKTLNLPVGQWDFVLVYHLLSRIDSNLRRGFEEKYSEVELPSYEQLKGFLYSKCEALLRDTHFSGFVSTNKSCQKVISALPQPKRNNMSHTLVAANGRPKPVGNLKPVPYSSKCPFCNGMHSITSCVEFIDKSIEERMQIAVDKKWCFNCLKPSHQLRNCMSVFSCRTCRRKHHTLLHHDKSIESPEIVSSSLVSRPSIPTNVLLSTALVQVRDAYGNMQSFRALFDTGSQTNLITESAVQRLRLTPTAVVTSVCGLGDTATAILGDVTCSVGINNKDLYKLDMHVISKICGDQPIAKLDSSGWSHIKSLPLADPGFDVPGPIDLLLAADVFAESLCNERIKGNSNQPTAFDSVFGWLLLGKTPLPSKTLLNRSLDLDNEFNSLDQLFLEQDSIPKPLLLTPEELLCERRFISDHSRDQTSRYIVHLPFRNDTEPIFEGSRDIALRRFCAIERRPSRESDLRAQDTNSMSDYIESGHMSAISIDQLGTDAREMYSQILIPSEYRNYQRIFWRSSPKDSLFFVRDIYFNLIPIEKVFLWSGSTVVLAWLRPHSFRWANFVANRVSQIQDATPIECWHHVMSGDNPADICSPEQFPAEILNNALWWAGPTWLSGDQSSWLLNSVIIYKSHTPNDEMIVNSEECQPVPLVSKEVNSGIVMESNLLDDLLNRFSSLQGILNIHTQRAKCLNPTKPLSIGTMVIVKNDNRGSLHWSLARVFELRSDVDGVARANNQLIDRPLVKLCHLSIED